jgi:hypothetical protein
MTRLPSISNDAAFAAPTSNAPRSLRGLFIRAACRAAYRHYVSAAPRSALERGWQWAFLVLARLDARCNPIHLVVGRDDSRYHFWG